DAGRHAGRDVRRDAFRRGREAGLEIGVDRQIGGADDSADVGQRGLEPGHTVGHAVRPREAGARRGERLEAETLQVAGRARVPRVGEDEAARFVETAKRATPLRERRVSGSHAGDAITACSVVDTRAPLVLDRSAMAITRMTMTDEQRKSVALEYLK